MQIHEKRCHSIDHSWKDRMEIAIIANDDNPKDEKESENLISDAHKESPKVIVSTEIPKDEQTLIVEKPREYSVGEKLYCRWRDGKWHKSEIVDLRRANSDRIEYYIHYAEFNKRLDEWVSDERLSVQLPEDKDQENNAGTADGKNEKEPIRKMTRNMKRKYDEENHVPKSFEDMDATTAILEKMHEENTKMKNINQIVLGKYVIDAWYCSPYPEEYANQALLFICEFCLKYMKLRSTYEKHKASCKHKHPPGDEIYRDGVISAYEVFGSKQKLYCQNLCLLSKLFLDHKTLYYDVDHFIFYILTEHDDDGTHLVGYFSKEKYSAEDYNLACIMILPCHQRKGYGKFLISLSYELSKREGKVGSPEKPLSDLGQLSYRSYWTQVLLDILYHYRGTLTIKEMSQITAMKIEDIVSTLQSLNLIRYWKGQHIISMTPKIVEEHLRESAKQQLRLDASKLFWLPYEFKPVKRK